MSEPEVPAVVLQYGRFDCTRRCIASLRQQSWPVEVVLVDGDSPGKSAPELRELAELADRSLLLDSNLGFAGGNNRAIEPILETGAEFFLIVNNDTTLDPQAVRELVRGMQAHPGAAQTCPQVWYPDGRLQAEGATIEPHGFEPRLLGHLQRPSTPAEDRRVIYAPGMAVLVRTAAVREVGILDESYFLYGEDADWSLRFAAAGWEIWHVPSARVVHHDSASVGTRSASKGYYLVRSNVLLAHRWLPEPAQAGFRRQLFWKLMRQSVRRWPHFAYVRGMWRGYFAGVRHARR